jgi:hypothetical protein
MDFFEKSFIVFLNSPCYETPKNAIKKLIKKKRASGYFFSGLRQVYVTFVKLFSTAPLDHQPENPPPCFLFALPAPTHPLNRRRP